MDSGEFGITIIVIGVFLGIIFGTIALVKNIDKNSCYEKAMFYKATVAGYSFSKDYCFIERDGKIINLNNLVENN